jgi:ABC-type multidrug transport system fused ATPase/permease subunit
MDEKIKNLWNTNKILFWILSPIILLLFLGFIFRDVVMAFLVGSARKTSQEARNESEKLESQMHKTEVEAAKSQAEVDAAARRIEERKEADISEDWNKKGK